MSPEKKQRRNESYARRRRRHGLKPTGQTRLKSQPNEEKGRNGLGWAGNEKKKEKRMRRKKKQIGPIIAPGPCQPPSPN